MHVHTQTWMNYGAIGGTRLARGRRIVVNEWERVVLVRNGSVVETLGAGVHRRWTGEVVAHRIDMRPWIIHVPLQEIPTADGVTVKLTIVAQVRVVDPVVRITSSMQGVEQLYLRVQVALRDLVAQSSLDDVVAGRATVGRRLAEAISDTGDTGIAVDRVEVKDVVLPAELKRAQAEVLLARAQGLAALERARAESAALRTLANAARLATETPALVDLRLLQELGRSSGHTVVIGQSAR